MIESRQMMRRVIPFVLLMAALASDVCSGHQLEEFARREHDKQALDELLKRLEFSGLRRQLVGRHEPGAEIDIAL